MSESKLWNESGPTGASALLITLLGEFARPALTPDGPSPHGIWTQTLVEALAGLGIKEKAARQALARLSDRGWLTREPVGRQTRWRLTKWATDLLASGAERIYGFGQRPAEPWSGEWLVLLASLPDGEGASRYRLTTGLRWIGLGTLGQGVWISPDTSVAPEVESLLDRLDLRNAPLFESRLTDRGDPVRLAAEAWELDALAALYLDFISQVDERVARPAGPLTDLTTLVHQWRYVPTIAPDLPPELLPPGFPAASAAARFTAERARLSPLAWDQWRELELRHTPQAKAG